MYAKHHFIYNLVPVIAAQLLLNCQEMCQYFDETNYNKYSVVRQYVECKNHNSGL